MFYVLPEIVFGCVALSVNLSYKFLTPYLVHMVPVVHVAHMIHVRTSSGGIEMGHWAKIGYHFHADVLVGLSNEKKNT